MDTDFTDSGSQASLTFHPDGNASFTVGDPTYATTDRTSWSLVAANARNTYGNTILEFSDSTYISSGYKFRVIPAYKDGKLMVYRSGLTRLSCDRTVQKNYPFNLYGNTEGELYRTMWNALIGSSTPVAQTSGSRVPDSTLPRLTGDELAGKTMQCSLLCREYYNTRYEPRKYSEFAKQEITVSVSTITDDNLLQYGNAFGPEYTIAGVSYRSVIQTSEGVFGIPPSASYQKSVFYKYSDNLSLLYHNDGVPINSTTDVYACETLTDNNLP